MYELEDSTIESINKKMDEAKNNKYSVYKYFQNSNADVDSAKEIFNYTLDNFEWVKDIYNRLLNCLFRPYENDPDDPYRVDGRVDRIRPIEECIKQHNDHEKQLEKHKEDPIISETKIQRNIFVNRGKYKEELETIIEYEFNTPHEYRKAAIDLLAYKNDNGKITFIIEELKACKLVGLNMLTEKEEAKDLLIRAMMEALFYGCYFKNALIHKGNDLANFLNDIIEDATFEQIKNAEIEYYIIAPESIVNQKDQDWFKIKGFNTNKFSFFTISQTTEIVGKVGDKIKYFNIIKRLN